MLGKSEGREHQMSLGAAWKVGAKMCQVHGMLKSDNRKVICNCHLPYSPIAFEITSSFSSSCVLVFDITKNKREITFKFRHCLFECSWNGYRFTTALLQICGDVKCYMVEKQNTSITHVNRFICFFFIETNCQCQFLRLVIYILTFIC